MVLKSLIILSETEADLTQAYTWYEAQKTGLGEEFLRCIDECMQLIRRNPEMYPIAYASYRRAVVRRFPYVIFYEHSDSRVTVYGIFHCSQNPEKWRGRL